MTPIPTFALPPLPADLWPELWRIGGGGAWPAAWPEAFAHLADRHRLLAIAAHDPSLPPDLSRAARGLFEPQRAAYEAQSRHYDDIVGELARMFDGDAYVLTKGAAFRKLLYPEASVRPMNDVDVITRPDTLTPIGETLQRHGYRRSTNPLYQNHLFFERPPVNLPVELLPRFTQVQRHAIDYAEVWRERTTEGVGAPRMADAHNLVLHTLSIANAIFDTHLRKYLDLWLMTRPDDVFEHAIDVAGRWRLRRVFYGVIRLLARAMPDSDTARLEQRSGRLLPLSTRRYLERRVLPPRELGPLEWRPVQLWRKFGLLDRHSNRVRFAAAHLLTSVRLSNPLG